MVDELVLRLVPDTLWDIVEPLVPRFEPHPRGGDTTYSEYDLRTGRRTRGPIELP